MPGVEKMQQTNTTTEITSKETKNNKWVVLIPEVLTCIEKYRFGLSELHSVIFILLKPFL